MCQLETKRWSTIESEGQEAPCPRSGHTAVALGDSDSIVLFGGIDFTTDTAFNDLYRFSKSGWSAGTGSLA